jgi:3'-phosphoadenosine 5'-phosphosulfate sulfotransferase (PAPS reductase)/FAD synthetase
MKNLFDPENKGRFGFYKWKFLIDSEIPTSEECCNVMKKAPAKKYAKETGRMPILGTMADESSLRYTNWLKHGCNAFEGKNPSSQPLSFWTKQDILHYIEKYDVPYCPVYGDIVYEYLPEQLKFDEILNITWIEDDEPIRLATTGCDRTGCIFCMFGCHLEKEPNRFQRLKETHPRQYEYCIKGGETVDGKWQPSKEGLGLGKVLDFIGVKYE